MSPHLEILMGFLNLIRRNFSASINVIQHPSLSRQVWAIPWTYSISIFSCGGHFYGESGTFISDGTTGCEWLLRAPTGKGIVLDFSLLPEVSCFWFFIRLMKEFKGLACSDFTVEVRRGRTSDKPLFISYCSTSDLNSIIATKVSTLYVKMNVSQKLSHFTQQVTKNSDTSSHVIS